MSGDQCAVSMASVVVRYGSTNALDGFDLEMHEGEILGLLGPNGSGKTTAVKVLATLQRPDEGTALVFGHDVTAAGREVRERIALTGQYAAVDELLTGRQNLEMFGELFGLDRRDARRRSGELLDRFDLADAGDRKVEGYSGGMRRRLDLASSLLTDPDLLFLDEPTTGLDPRSRNTIWEAIRDLAADGATILLTTQYLDEADALADRIAVMDHGRVIASGTPDELKEQSGGLVIDVRLLSPDDAGRADELLGALDVGAPDTPVSRDGVSRDGVSRDGVSREGDARVVMHVGDDPVATLARAADALADDGLSVRSIALRGPDLDDVFLRLTGDGPADTGDATSKDETGSKEEP